MKKIDAKEYGEMIKKITSSEIVMKSLEAKLFMEDLPMGLWSVNNMNIVFSHGYNDARTFMQWKKVGRHVRKGEKAFHIYKPLTYKNDDDEIFLYGFAPQPEFGYEQTEGEELEYKMKAVIPKNIEKVLYHMGIKVRTGIAHSLGYYSSSNKEIVISSDDPTVIYHESAHAIDDYFGTLGNDKIENELVAEFSAALMMKAMNIDHELGETKKYLNMYRDVTKDGFVRKMNSLYNRIIKIVNFMIEHEELCAVS